MIILSSSLDTVLGDYMSETENQDEVKELEKKVETVTLSDTKGDSKSEPEGDGVGTSILGFEKEDPFKEAGEDAAG